MLPDHSGSLFLGGWLLVSNVKFGSPLSMCEVGHTWFCRNVPWKSSEDTCSSLSWDWLPLPQGTGTHVPHGHSFQQLRWSCGPVLQRSDRWATGRLWFVCEIEEGWQFQVSWHLQRLGTSKWKVLCWEVGKWRRWRQVIPVSRLRTTKYHLKVHLNNVGDLNDMECDDIASQTVNSIGDFRRVFVR